MKFDGTASIADVMTEEVWVAMGDPVMIRQTLPGCQYLVEVEDEPVNFDAIARSRPTKDPETLPEANLEEVAERTFETGGTYAALMQLSVGPLEPTFETVVRIDEREFPRMDATVTGDAGSSSFEIVAGMELTGTDWGTEITWQAEADVSGRVAALGEPVIKPAANHVVDGFFEELEAELRGVRRRSGSSLSDHVSRLF